MVVDLKVLVRNVVDDGFHVIDGWFGESFLGVGESNFFSANVFGERKK